MPAKFVDAMAERSNRRRSKAPATRDRVTRNSIRYSPTLRFARKLAEILKANNIDTPLDDMPPEAQRNILRQVLAAQNKDQ